MSRNSQNPAVRAKAWGKEADVAGRRLAAAQKRVATAEGRVQDRQRALDQAAANLAAEQAKRDAAAERLEEAQAQIAGGQEGHHG